MSLCTPVHANPIDLRNKVHHVIVMYKRRAHWRSYRGLRGYVVTSSPFFENLDLVIRPDLHRYSDGGGRNCFGGQ